MPEGRHVAALCAFVTGSHVECVARGLNALRLANALQSPQEAAKIRTQAAWVCAHAGLASQARHYGERAAQLLRQVHRHSEADRVLAASRSARGAAPERRGDTSFDHPIFWGAFHLVGRVT